MDVTAISIRYLKMVASTGRVATRKLIILRLPHPTPTFPCTLICIHLFAIIIWLGFQFQLFIDNLVQILQRFGKLKKLVIILYFLNLHCLIIIVIHLLINHIYIYNFTCLILYFNIYIYNFIKKLKYLYLISYHYIIQLTAIYISLHKSLALNSSIIALQASLTCAFNIAGSNGLKIMRSANVLTLLRGT